MKSYKNYSVPQGQEHVWILTATYCVPHSRCARRLSPRHPLLPSASIAFASSQKSPNNAAKKKAKQGDTGPVGLGSLFEIKRCGKSATLEQKEKTKLCET